jgi:hypothetical protein
MTSTELIPTNIIETSLEVIKTGGVILQENKQRTTKALVVGQNIIDKFYEAGKMDADLDLRANNFLANCRKAKAEMNEARKPITQIFDSIKSEFTSTENLLDTAKADSIPCKIQNLRDQYAKDLKDEADRKRAEADAKANKEKEIIELNSTLELQFSNFMNDVLLTKKQSLNTAFSNITLENFAEKEAGLRKLNPTFPLGLWSEFRPALKSQFISHQDAETIIENVKRSYLQNESSNPYSVKYITELTTLKNELIDRLPSKKTELEAMAKAGVDEKAKLEKEAADRKLAEEKKMQEDAEKSKLEASQKIELDKVAEQTQVLFNKEVEIASNVPTPESRTGYNIEVKHPIGYTQIFQLWFEKEGKGLPTDKIGNTKLDQMKTWCEKLAHKTGEKIESAYVEYHIELKAINKKSN